MHRIPVVLDLSVLLFKLPEVAQLMHAKAEGQATSSSVIEDIVVCYARVVFDGCDGNIFEV